MQASQIVAALRANSADAPGELFDAYGEQLIAHCWQALRSDDATLIAVRDTMIVAQAHAYRLGDPELLEPWLLALARAECGRRRVKSTGRVRILAAAGERGGGDEGPPAAAWMRDEILACFADPGQARYRAVAAARVPRLGADGFPSGGIPLPRRSGKPGRRVRGGLVTAGAAVAAAMVLVVAGLSLRGGAWPSAPAASASPSPIAAGGGPSLGNSATPQVSNTTGIQLVGQPPDPANLAPAAAGQNSQAFYDVASTGPAGHPVSAMPPAPPGLPALPPESGGPSPSPGASQPAPPWQQPGPPWRPRPSWQPSASPSATDGQPSTWASMSPTPSETPSPASPSPTTGSPAPQPQPSTQAASPGEGGQGGQGGQRRHGPEGSPPGGHGGPRGHGRHGPNPSSAR